MYRLLFLSILLFFPGARAQWTQTTCPGADIRTLAVMGSTLFAGVDDGAVSGSGGVYRSTDNGLTWTSAKTGLTNTSIRALDVNGTTLFVATYGGGVFRSTDQGTNWTAVNTGITIKYAQAIHHFSSRLFCGTIAGAYASADNGAVWTSIKTGMTNLNIRAFCNIDTNLFAATFCGGIFLSTNNGSTWTPKNSLLFNTCITSLTIIDTAVFVGTIDGGIYAGNRQGLLWARRDTGLTKRTINALGHSGSMLFAGTLDGGIFVSTDNGMFWAGIDSGLPQTDIQTIAVNTTHLYAGTAGCGVLLMPDGRTIKQSQPFHRCGKGGAATSQYTFPDVDIYGFGNTGSHGGSAMSAIGGTLRLGELVPGAPPIHHALKINLQETGTGYRWPAIHSDANGPKVLTGKVEGALYALPPTLNIDSMFVTEPAKYLARAFQDYGAYLVDGTGWSIYAIETEWSPDGRFCDEFYKAWGYNFGSMDKSSPWAQDMDRLFTNLSYIENNVDGNLGGGGIPRAPLAPDSFVVAPAVPPVSPCGK